MVCSSLVSPHETPIPEFTAWLPLRRYELTICHKLLSQLGRISHFLIICLSRQPLTMTQIETLTALSAIQLSPIIKRLQGLQILDDLTLTKTGQRYAYLLENVHEKSAAFWMNASYGRAPCLISDCHPLITQYSQDEILIGAKAANPFQWPVTDWNEDCSKQMNFLKGADEQYAWLSWLFPVFLSISDKTDRWWGEWELNLRVIESQAIGFGLPVKLFLAQAKAEHKSVLDVFSSVICLETEYSIPDGFPNVYLHNLLKKNCLYFDCFLEEIHDTMNGLVEDRGGNFLSNNCDDEEAIDAFAQARYQRFIVEPSEMMLNRHHTLTQLWKKYEFGWASIMTQLYQVGDNWFRSDTHADD